MEICAPQVGSFFIIFVKFTILLFNSPSITYRFVYHDMRIRASPLQQADKEIILHNTLRYFFLPNTPGTLHSTPPASSPLTSLVSSARLWSLFHHHISWLVP